MTRCIMRSKQMLDHDEDERQSLFPLEATYALCRHARTELGQFGRGLVVTESARACSYFPSSLRRRYRKDA